MVVEDGVTRANSSSSNDNNNNDNNNNNNKRIDPEIQQANMALDKLAEACGNTREASVISIAAKCESQWREMSESSSIVSFNIVLKAWSKCCHSLAEQKRNRIRFDDSEDAAKLTAQAGVYTARDAAQHATDLLISLQEDDDAFIRPDATSYNAVIDAWAKSRLDDAPQKAEQVMLMLKQHLIPDSFSFNALMDAYAYQVNNNNDILRQVKTVYREMQSNNISPTIRSVNSVLHAYSRSVQRCMDDREYERAAETAKSAQEWFRKTFTQHRGEPLVVEPDVMSYSCLMDAHAKCGTYEATQQVEALLDEIKHATDIRLNERIYGIVMTAWSRTKAPQAPARASALLQEMKQQQNIKPNARTYTAVLLSWGRSRDPHKAERALELLKEMKRQDDDEIRPNIVAYNTAIDVCSRTPPYTDDDPQLQTKALRIAFAIFQSLQADEFVRPNRATFKTLLKATRQLLPPGKERNDIAAAVFEKACRAGIVDVDVIGVLKSTVDPQTRRELIDEKRINHAGSTSLHIQDFPSSWSRNIRN